MGPDNETTSSSDFQHAKEATAIRTRDLCGITQLIQEGGARTSGQWEVSSSPPSSEIL